MDSPTLLGVFVVSVGLTLICSGIGSWIGRRDHTNDPEGTKHYNSAAVGAALGLLAFMLALTFGSTTSRHDVRKQLVLSEANAIGTAFLRTELLPQPYKDEAKCLLTKYTAVRLQTQTVGDRSVWNRSIAESEELHHKLWKLAIKATEPSPTEHTHLYLEANNELIDLHQERITYGIEFRLPILFWITLFALTGISTLMAGYEEGFSGYRRTYKMIFPLAIAFALMITLIFALDRPSKLFSITHEPLKDVQASIKSTSLVCD